MTTQELRIAETLREGMAANWRFQYLESRNVIRAYGIHGVTIMTVELAEHSEAAQNEFIDIVMPAL